MMSKYQFDGYPKYLAAATETLGLSTDSIAEAQQQPAISRLASLIGQTVDQAPQDRAATLRYARRFRDALWVAAVAADAMLHEARTAHGLSALPPLVVTPEPEPESRSDESEKRNKGKRGTLG